MMEVIRFSFNLMQTCVRGEVSTASWFAKGSVSSPFPVQTMSNKRLMSLLSLARFQARFKSGGGMCGNM